MKRTFYCLLFLCISISAQAAQKHIFPGYEPDDNLGDPLFNVSSNAEANFSELFARLNSSTNGPGGSAKAVQFNAGSSFGGDTNLTWDAADKALYAAGISIGGIFETPTRHGGQPGSGIDNAVPLQAAINATPDGGTLVIPDGIWATSQQLTNDSKTIFIVGSIGGGVSDYTYRTFSGAPFRSTPVQTTLEPLGGYKTNFTLFKATDSASVHPSIRMQGLHFDGLDGLATFTGVDGASHDTNRYGFGGTNYTLVVTENGSGCVGVDLSALDSDSQALERCMFTGWSTAGLITGGGIRVRDVTAQLCSIGVWNQGHDAYFWDLWLHNNIDAFVNGSLVTNGYPADIYANWASISDSRIEWNMKHGVWNQAGQRFQLKGSFIDRSGLGGFVSDGPYNYNCILVGDIIARSGNFWRGINPTNIPTASIRDAANIFIQNGNESIVDGLNVADYEFDSGDRGPICPMFGAVLDSARGTDYRMVDTGFDNVTNVIVFKTNSVNNLTVKTSNEFTKYNDLGVIAYQQISTNLYVPAISAQTMGLNTPVEGGGYYLGALGTNTVAIWFSQLVTNRFFQIALGQNGHLFFNDIKTGHSDLDLGNDMWTFRNTVAIEGALTNTIPSLTFRSKQFDGTNTTAVDRWSLYVNTDGGLHLYDVQKTNDLLSAASGGGDLVINRNIRASFLHPNNMSSNTVAISGGDGNLASVANAAGFLRNDGLGGYDWKGSTNTLPVYSVTTTNGVVSPSGSPLTLESPTGQPINLKVNGSNRIIVNQYGNLVCAADLGYIFGDTGGRPAWINTGGFISNVRTITISSAIATTDSLVILNGTTLTATLPTAVGVSGQEYTVKLITSSTGTVATTSSQTIDGASSYSLSAQWKYVRVKSDGANWMMIGSN